jgi:GNAT superfamily N-acetyltransferase
MIFSPSSTVPIELGPGPTRHARLVPFPPSAGPRLAAAIVAMPPWSVMAYPAERLAQFLANADSGARRHLVEVDGQEAGLVSVRDPWLKGPYLELLALLPPFQSQGLGSAILAWLEREAVAGGARNLWVCASSFNKRALRFYEQHGFARAATLPGLVADGYDEILLRKFPL